MPRLATGSLVPSLCHHSAFDTFIVCKNRGERSERSYHVSDGNVHLGRCRGKGLNELAAFL